MVPGVVLKDDRDLRYLVYQDLESLGFLCRQVIRCDYIDNFFSDNVSEVITGFFDRWSVSYKGIVVPVQVHGDRVVIVDASKTDDIFLPNRPYADAILLKEAGFFGVLRFADCCPLVLWDKRGSMALGIAHCGFKGLLEGVVFALVSEYKKAISITDKEAKEVLSAYVGPSIGFCCYDRSLNGDEYTIKALKVIPEDFWEVYGDKVRFDISKALACQLVLSGLDKKNIKILNYCTSCNSHLFYSYRRGDTKKRQFLVVGIPET